MFFFSEPGPCPVCGTAHAACKGERDDSTGVGTTRGLVVVRQAPMRDQQAAVTPAVTASVSPASTGHTRNRIARRTAAKEQVSG